mgnify:CR=1 FL=1
MGSMSTRSRRWRHGIPLVVVALAGALGLLGGCADPGQRKAVTEWAAGQKIFVKVNDISAVAAPGSGGLTVDQWTVDAEVADTVSIAELEALGQAMDAARVERKLGYLGAIIHGRGWTVQVPGEPGRRAAALALLTSTRAAVATFPSAGCSAPDVRIQVPGQSGSDGALNAAVDATAPVGEFLACASALADVRSSTEGLTVPSSVATRLNTSLRVLLSTAKDAGTPVTFTFDPQAQEPGQPTTDAPILQTLLADPAVTQVSIDPERVSWSAPDWARAESSWRTIGRLTGDHRSLSVSFDASSGTFNTLSFTPKPGVTSGLIADLKATPGVVSVFMPTQTLIVETTDRAGLRRVLDTLPDGVADASLRTTGPDGWLTLEGSVAAMRQFHPLAYAASRPDTRVLLRTGSPFLLDITWPLVPGQANPGGSAPDPEKFRAPVSEVAEAVRAVGWVGGIRVRLSVGDDHVRFDATPTGPAKSIVVSRSASAETPLDPSSPRIAHVMAQSWDATVG